VGSARSALFNWFVARQHSDGVFILRIEDTDESRNQVQWVDGIISAMKWLGLDTDEGPFHQSDNSVAHELSLTQLQSAGLLYYCDCTSDDVAARKGDNKTPGYDGFCRERNLAKGPTTALRFKTPHSGVTVVHDLIRGDVTFSNDTIEDFVVARSNGAVLYALANVTDDRNDSITHVIRGEEHISNVPKQMMMWEALNDASGEEVPLPLYAHLPLLVNEQRKKLSKRRDPVATESYRDKGYLSAAFVNYLALLGWSPRGDEEIVPLPMMIEQFRLEDVSHSPAFFDVKKLTHMNGEYVRALSPNGFVEACVPWVAPWTSEWVPEGFSPPWTRDSFDEELFVRVAPLVQERVAVLSEVPAMVSFFFVDVPVYDEAAFDKTLRNDPLAQALLALSIERFEECPWNASTLHDVVVEIGESMGLNLRKAQAPIRCAVTGTLVGPPLFESLEILGRDATLRRIHLALEKCSR
jgi:glutamyl-tRNA synthetase